MDTLLGLQQYWMATNIVVVPPMTKPSLHRAASGHLTLDFNDLPESYWLGVSLRLESHHGFTRVGPAVPGAHEQIHQGFARPDFALAAGWDNWSGHYLLSDSAEGDDFLQMLYDELNA